MTAGLNLIGNVWRFTTNDDSIGGALPTGTVIYTNVEARIHAAKPTLALLEQGLETPTIFTGVLAPGNISLQHNDQLEITSPPISDYYQKKFVVIGIQNLGFYDPRKYVVVTLRRLVIAHSNNLQ